jgi:hypothetical protein
MLIGQRRGNINFGTSTDSLIALVTNYTPPVNATAFISARCAVSGNAANRSFSMRAARRLSSGGAWSVGTSYYITVTTAVTNQLVPISVYDFYDDLVAGTSYDFGVNITGLSNMGTLAGNHDCSMVVQIFSR